MEKSPPVDVVVVREIPVASLVATIVTPGSTPPVESATRPEMLPRNVCASQRAAYPSSSENSTAGRRFAEDIWAPPWPERPAVAGGSHTTRQSVGPPTVTHNVL